MRTVKRLALIAVGYALCVVAGLAAVTVNELRMPDDVAQGSPGMVAFGDMILFVLVTGFAGVVPTWPSTATGQPVTAVPLQWKA